VRPGALTALLAEVAATPERGEVEPPKLPPGTVMGRFEIVREVGRGGFGVVYEAKDRELGRLVALKSVRPGTAEEETEKVAREAEAIARLTHPNLVTLHDVGRSAAGPYLVFEFLRGQTLQERMSEGPLPVQEAVHVAVEVARGLAYAHSEGVVHRDLKPSNVFLTSRGQVKILDFGMAHAFGRRRISGGTPAYMAPEQWEDDPEDERTDVFALGVMLHRMLTGEYPFPEGKGRWAAEDGTAPKLDVPGAPGLAELVDGMLARTPKGRPRDGAAVLAALTPIEDALRTRPADGAPPVHATRRKASLGDLLAELRRRRVFRVMVGYGIFAFAVLQVTEPILHAYDLPTWALTAVVTTLAAGFPVAVILAWLYDLTAQGVKRTPTASRVGGRSVPRSGLAALLVGATLAAAIPVGGWYAWKRARAGGSAGAAAVQPSVAVLPFADMSPSRDLEYFGDGIAEEILNALAQVNELKVIGRTSSFSFKGKADDLRAIGQKLGVETILEGSVRKEGGILRITAQLIRAADGSHLWSRVFDRGEGGVLAIQEEVARAVTKALQVKLLPGQDLRAAWLRTERPEAYDQLLQGRTFGRRGTVEDSRRAMAAYERAVAIDPGYAAAWAGIATAAVSIWSKSDEPAPEMVEKGLAAAEKAVALAPDLPQGYVIRGGVRDNFLGDKAGAALDFARAEALQPRKAGEGSAAPTKASREERLRSRIDLLRTEVDRDPLHPGLWTQLGYWYLAADDLGHAREALGRALEISPGHLLASDYMCQCLVAQGRHEEALALAAGIRSGWLRLWCTAVAQHGLGHERESKEALDALIARYPDQATYQIAEVHAWRGDADRAFEWLERAFQSHDTGLNMMTVVPLLRSLRADPRWAPLVEKVHGPQG
jgi:adenylate cyclase